MTHTTRKVDPSISAIAVTVSATRPVERTDTLRRGPFFDCFLQMSGTDTSIAKVGATLARPRCLMMCVLATGSTLQLSLIHTTYQIDAPTLPTSFTSVTHKLDVLRDAAQFQLKTLGSMVVHFQKKYTQYRGLAEKLRIEIMALKK